MELRIKEIQFPQVIEFNFEDLRNEITTKAEVYKNMVYTDETIKEAKADKANLNKFVKALEDKRKEVKKQCLEPYEVFEKQIKELVAIVNEPVCLIDTQVKAYEDKEKQVKQEEIEKMFSEIGFQNFVKLEHILDPKWLNKSVSLKSIKTEMEEKRNSIGTDVMTINLLPEFSFEALDTYKRTLDLNKAIAEGQRLADLQKRKVEAAEQARLKEEAENDEVELKIEPVPTVAETIESTEKQAFERATTEEPARQWIGFQALLTVEEALELKKFFDARKIEFRAI